MSVCNGRYEFHPKCHEVALTHLAFADDVTFFCKGSERAVTTLKQCLDMFSGESSLQFSVAKSNVYMGGLDVEQEVRLCNILNMEKGELHVRYLGVPLQSRGLKCVEFHVLINKLISYIKRWVAHKLSYGGRVCLIRAVLDSVTHF